MARSQRDPWSHHRRYGLATLLFIVASMGVLSACVPPATLPQTIHTVYFASQYGSVDALQSENGSLRWHKQLDKMQWSVDASLLVFGGILYIGRTNETCSRDCVTPSSYTYTGSIDALKGSDGSVLWHSKVDVHNKDLNRSLSFVKVIAVVNHIVYVGVYEQFGGNFPGEVYALQATTGALLWHYTLQGGCCRGLVVTPTAVYFGGLDYVDALKTSDGTLLWHHHIDRPRDSLGIVVADGVVYVGTALSAQNGAVDALRASDGTLIWHSQTNMASVVFTVANGVVYVGAFWQNTLDALRASDGSLLWQYKSDRSIGQVTIMEGVAYITSDCIGNECLGSTVDALQTSTRTHVWSYKLAQEHIQGIEVANGMIHVYTSHGIAALEASSGKQRWFHAADQVFALAGGP